MPAKGTEIPREEPKSAAELARRLKVSATAIGEWKKLEGAPQDFAYQAWRDFMEARGLGVASNRTSKSRDVLLQEKLAKENRLLDLRIAKEERTVIDRLVVDAMLLRLGSLQKTVLFQKLEKEMPAKAAAHGANVEAMQKLGRETADALCEIFSGEMDRWTEAQ